MPDNCGGEPENCAVEEEASVVVVTGGNGKLGRAIVEKLLHGLPSTEIGVSVRGPEKAHARSGRGVRVRKGDFSDKASLRHAFEGASQVLIVSGNSLGDTVVQHYRNAIEAAHAAGAQRVLYTSHMGVNPASAFPPMRDHSAAEISSKRT